MNSTSTLNAVKNEIKDAMTLNQIVSRTRMQETKVISALKEMIAAGEVKTYKVAPGLAGRMFARNAETEFPCAGCGSAKHGGPCGGGRYEI